MPYKPKSITLDFDEYQEMVRELEDHRQIENSKPHDSGIQVTIGDQWTMIDRQLLTSFIQQNPDVFDRIRDYARKYSTV